MQDVEDVIFGSPHELIRPVLREAYAWARPLLSADGMLARNQVSPANLAPFIRHASLFEIITVCSVVTDFRAKVLASHIADNMFEISGLSGRDSLPEALFERWRLTGQKLIDDRKSLRTRSQVFGKEHKNAESLIIPVTEDGELRFGLVFTEYWLSPTNAPA